MIRLIKDLVSLMQKRMPQEIYDINAIKKLFRIYMAYYLENPNVFKFFYFHQLNQPNKAKDEETEIDFPEMWKETFKGFVLKGKISVTEIEVVAKIFIYAMHGMLTLSFSNNGDLNEELVYQDLEKMVDYVLK